MDMDLFYRMVENLPVGILVVDAQGNYLYVNQEYCSIVGKDKEFFTDMSVMRLQKLGYLTTNVWEQVMAKKQTVVSVISIVNKHRNSVYDTLTTGVPLFDEKGDIEYVVYRQETVDQLYAQMQKGALNKQLYRSGESGASAMDDIVAESREMKHLLEMTDIVAGTDATILITGPSGVGKELIARRIHQLSEHRAGPLVVLNCAALPESLMESELFGYEKGAFTGAVDKGKKGLIETAGGGTLFIDEINSMPLAVQAKLLRVLETKQVTPVGGVKARDIEFRLVCASNEDLPELVEAHRFRADLFYRINVISVNIPALCKRKKDIYPLAHHFMEQFCRKYNRIKVLSASVVELMEEYDWPGNVRELRNFVERMIILSPEQEWEISSVPAGSFAPGDAVEGKQTATQHGPQPALAMEEGLTLREYMDACEKDVLQRTLERYGSPKKAADALGLDLSNVYRKLQKHRIAYKSA